MRVYYNEYLALVYAEMFGFPLTRAERVKWAIGKKKLPKMEVAVDRKLIMLRKEREKLSELKLLKILRTLKFFKEIETIEAIFVTGSVAVLNAKEDSDIDVMIVVRPGSLWRTRLKLLKLLRKLKLLRDKSHIKDRICTNIFLDSEHLEIVEKNLYTAHEVLQAKCVFDRGGIEKRWLTENLWVREFLPNSLRHKDKGLRIKTKKVFSPLEFIAFAGQYLYMWPKMTKEKVGLGFAFFHPIDGSDYYGKEFQKRLYNKAR